MSGARVSYQVRPNKYVERHIFVDLLSHLGRMLPIEDYLYVSMGGRLLEDFKLVHGRLNLTKMMSIEGDDLTLKRQIFSCPLEHINCEKMTSKELVDNFETHTEGYGDTGVIVWLDYTSPKDRGKQLSEFANLVAKLRAYDVVKITLNSNLKTLGTWGVDLNPEDKAENDLLPQQKRLNKLRSQLDEYLDKELTPADLTSQMLPNILADSIGRAARIGSESDRSTFIEPLAVLVYNDGFHDMLTTTSIVLPYSLGGPEAAGKWLDEGEKARAAVNAFHSQTRLKNWPFLANDWPDVRRILIPDLSIKERLKIHECLKEHENDLDAVDRALPFRIGDNEGDITKEAIKMYVQYYRYYPNFLPVNI